MRKTAAEATLETGITSTNSARVREHFSQGIDQSQQNSLIVGLPDPERTSFSRIVLSAGCSKKTKLTDCVRFVLGSVACG